MSVNDLLDVMGCFRRQGTIMSPAAAQTMLDNSFGIDLMKSTHLGTLYNKNGLWQSGASQTEQSLAYFLPRDMELVVLANSPIGDPGQFFRDVVTNIYLDNIARRSRSAAGSPVMASPVSTTKKRSMIMSGTMACS